MSKGKTDAELLASLGYRQELRRHFTPIEVFGIGFSIMGLLPSIASTIGFALPNGGPTTLVWGWAVASIFILLVALSLGELSSAAPTSGGLYFWTFKYASPRYRKFLSWVVGYSNTMGIVAGASSTQWGCAVQLMAAVSIGSDLTFTPTTGQIYGVYVALLLVAGVISSAATKWVARLQGLYAAINLLMCLAIIIALPTATPHEFKNHASFALGGFSNFTSWPSGFAFVLGFLTPLWSIGGFDAPIHISEEVSNARTAVPWAIVSAVGITGFLGWVVNIVIVFHMGTNIENILGSPIGQPLAAICFNSFGTKPTVAVWSVIVAIQFMTATSAYISASRQIFAFSRDGALPLSRVLYRINPHTHTPANAVWFAILCGVLLGLLAFAGSSAINAVFSLAVTGQYIAFSIPIASRLWAATATATVNDREEKDKPMKWTPGPFNLGAMSTPVSVVSILWSIFSIIIVMFPSNPNPNAQDMNYTVVVGGGWILLCVIYYWLPIYGGARWFEGPVGNLTAHGALNCDGAEIEEESDKLGEFEEKAVSEILVVTAS